jgi:hypothetical protein
LWSQTVLVEKRLRDDFGESRYSYQYDWARRQTRVDFFNAFSALEWHEEWHYSDSGLMESYRRYRESEQEWKTLYGYDRNNRKRIVSDFDHGTLVRRLHFEYRCQ